MRTILMAIMVSGFIASTAHAQDRTFETNSDYYERLRAEAELFLALGEREAAWAHACRIPSFRDTDSKTGKNCPAK